MELLEFEEKRIDRPIIAKIVSPFSYPREGTFIPIEHYSTWRYYNIKLVGFSFLIRLKVNEASNSSVSILLYGSIFKITSLKILIFR